ncbi:hypothetical protein [Streptomyces formicae]|uniref:Uncharacterized protein n=1 Tax=Streptomyces formicae TaxID=1616117 RepID=A0ABY3WQQ9_9ACTN|nr:hypothetical protein [Streptomyces formicae]UNM14957.1 hypothetical protein J4032_28945 [Streptomyces formicae]
MRRGRRAEPVARLLLEVDTRNCWTLAQVLRHPGPHRLQHLLPRARFDHDQARERSPAWWQGNSQAGMWCW